MTQPKLTKAQLDLLKYVQYSIDVRDVVVLDSWFDKRQIRSLNVMASLGLVERSDDGQWTVAHHGRMVASGFTFKPLNYDKLGKLKQDIIQRAYYRGSVGEMTYIKEKDALRRDGWLTGARNLQLTDRGRVAFEARQVAAESETP